MLHTFVSYKLQRWYTFVIGLTITISNRWNTSLISRKPRSMEDYSKNKNSFTMISRCRCGQCELNIHWNTGSMMVDNDEDGKASPDDSIINTINNNDNTKNSHILKPDTTQTFDCYCRYCRTYHGGAFTSYLEVSDHQIQIIKQSTIKYYVDKCDEIGSNVTRIFCSQCYCKLATTTTTTDTTTTTTTSKTTSKDKDTTPQKWYMNMGCIADETIRADYSIYWRTNRSCKQQDEASLQWYPALPKYKKKNCIKNHPSSLSLLSSKDTNTVLTGGCSCGNAQYKIIPYIDIPNELPHCYCHLCRQMSGTAFVSWLYITTKNFIWTTNTPKLIRTTSFGQRHVCTICGVVLTIVYDKEKNKYIWPTAASIHDLPNMDQYLESVSHIYCHNNAIWYQLPNDGLPRYYDE
jgi:hypothetical protein